MMHDTFVREVYHVTALAHRLLEWHGHYRPEMDVATIERIRPGDADNSWTSAFANGFTDGQAARSRNQPLSAYVRVGIDDYARGYRQGFYNRTTPAARAPRPSSRPIIRL